MINKKGQALVEFVIVLPVIILLIFALFDIGRIIIAKSHLESVISNCVDMANSDRSIEEIREYVNNDQEYKITFIEIKGTYTIYRLETKIDLVTPGMKRILKNPYKVSIERRILDE